ncbi:hypothetical protein JCM8097_007702 [Rhodosporidiobolus ruineniae]
MPFSRLPPELKERIIGLVLADDLVYRKQYGLDEDETQPSRPRPAFRPQAWDGWLGRSALALSSVSKEVRALALPLILRPLRLGKVNYHDHYAVLRNGLAAHTHSLVLDSADTSPAADRMRDPSRFARELYERPWRALIDPLDIVSECMPRLRSVTLSCEVSHELERMFEALAREPDKYLLQPDRPDRSRTQLRGPLASHAPRAAPKFISPKDIALGGGLPFLAKLAQQVESWYFPAGMRLGLILPFLVLSPTTIRHLTFDRAHKPYCECVLGAPVDPELAAALGACLHLGATPSAFEVADDDAEHEAAIDLPSLALLELSNIPLFASRDALSLLQAPTLRVFDVHPALEEPALRTPWSTFPHLHSESIEHLSLCYSLAAILGRNFPALKLVHCHISDTNSHRTHSATALALPETLAKQLPHLHVQVSDTRRRHPRRRAKPAEEAAQAVKLARWVRDEVERARNAGDEGAVRMLLGSLGDVAHLRETLQA